MIHKIEIKKGAGPMGDLGETYEAQVLASIKDAYPEVRVALLDCIASPIFGSGGNPTVRVEADTEQEEESVESNVKQIMELVLEDVLAGNY